MSAIGWPPNTVRWLTRRLRRMDAPDGAGTFAGRAGPYRPDEGLTVHVRESFKGEILDCRLNSRSSDRRRAEMPEGDEGEIIELMLELQNSAEKR